MLCNVSVVIDAGTFLERRSLGPVAGCHPTSTLEISGSGLETEARITFGHSRDIDRVLLELQTLLQEQRALEAEHEKQVAALAELRAQAPVDGLDDEIGDHSRPASFGTAPTPTPTRVTLREVKS